MKNLLILVYMFLLHPVLFWKYSVRSQSRYFLANGSSQNIKTGKLKLGQYVRIGNYTRIRFFDAGSLSIGSGCYTGQRNTYLVGADINIGKGVLMASDICITSENHGTDPLDERGYSGQDLKCDAVTIGDGCWIGEKAVILAGVSIGEKSIVGAGSVVTKDIPPYCIAAGNPARILKRFDKDKKEWIRVKG